MKSRIPDGLRIDRAIRLLWTVSPIWAIGSVFLLLVQALLPLLSLYVLKLLVDYLTLQAADGGGGGSFRPILFFILVAFILAATGSIVSALLAYANLEQAHRAKDLVLNEVQKKSVAMDLEFYESPRYHDKLHRAQQEATGRPTRIVQGLYQVGRSSVTLGGALILLMRFHWGVAIALVGATIPTLYYRLNYAHRIYEWHREKTASERLANYINQVLTNTEHAKEVRIFGYGPALIERFRTVRDRLRSGILKLAAQRSRKQVITEITAGLASFAALAFIAFAAFNATISLGDLVMYFGAFQVALVSVKASLQGLAELYENNLYLSTLYEFLDAENSLTVADRPERVPQRLREGLRVEGLSFKYPGTDRMVLRNLEMVIRPGETVALVGRNGSGKTTLAKLLCRLYDPTSGRITIDGTDLRDFDNDEFRRIVGSFFQDFGRYSLTGRENIWLGNSELDLHSESIVDAAKAAEIHDALSNLPQGYETILSRSLAAGQELSIGHWQKLALARVIVRDSLLVILDEPTSFLDAVAEMEFFESFGEIISGRSAFLISHRLSTAKLADKICVLQDGYITEQGAHEDLMRQGGVYSELYRNQASYYLMDESEQNDLTLDSSRGHRR